MFVKKEITAGNTGTDGDKKQNGRKKRGKLSMKIRKN